MNQEGEAQTKVKVKAAMLLVDELPTEEAVVRSRKGVRRWLGTSGWTMLEKMHYIRVGCFMSRGP